MNRFFDRVGLAGTLMFGIVASLGNSSAQAETRESWTTICTIEQGSGPVAKIIAWNSNTGKARITHSDGTYPGKVTHSQKHNNGTKLNLRFEYGDRYGMHESEYIVFPMPLNGFRVIGIAFFRDGGERHLQNLEGAADANCISP
jgi:hypothetical protein